MYYEKVEDKEMINVAIIEDDISSQNDVVNFLNKYGQEKQETFQAGY